MREDTFGHYPVEVESEFERKKRDQIATYLESIGHREQSVFRLSKDARFYIDPEGLDPLQILPTPFLTTHLGGFRQQALEKFQQMPTQMGETKRFEDLRPEDRDNSGWEKIQEECPGSGVVAPPSLMQYEKGTILEAHIFPRGVKLEADNNAVGRDHVHVALQLWTEEAQDNQPVFDALGSAWKYWRQANEQRQLLLGLHLSTRKGESLFPIQSSGEWSQRSPERLLHDFCVDPGGFLIGIHQERLDEQQLRVREQEFLDLWREAFGFVRDGRKQLYPGQTTEALPGMGVAMLEQAIRLAERHGYAGITSTPAYFHNAENLEKQGFVFVDTHVQPEAGEYVISGESDEQESHEYQPSSQDMMNMLKVALRALDEQNYEKARGEVVGKGLGLEQVGEHLQGALLNPQERSWIVLLNSLKTKDLIPSEWDLTQVLAEKVTAELQSLHRSIQETQQFLDALRHGMDGAQYEATFRRVQNTLSPYEAKQYQELGTDWWVKTYYQQKLYDLLGRKSMFLNWQEWLSKGNTIEFPLAHVSYTNPLINPDEEALAAMQTGVTMCLYFGAEREDPILAGQQLDSLIEKEIITGGTLNAPAGYVAELFTEDEATSPKHARVVYHMYDKNSPVPQPDGTMLERDNSKHFAQVKQQVEKMLGRVAYIEQVQGNVHNPGPSQPLGWEVEKPSVWIDELKGIEKSGQQALVIACTDIQEIERVVAYLQQVGCKVRENETGTDPAWVVPDIRVVGFDPAKFQKLPAGSPLKRHFREAVLHIKRGQQDDGYGATITHMGHRLVTGFKHVPVLIHERMDSFIELGEQERGAYEFLSR